MDWKKIKKIDAHVHVLPPERLKLYKEDRNDPWSHADIGEYLAVMEEYNVEKAVLVPVNDGRMYYGDADRTNQWFGADRLIFATDYPDVWFTRPEEIYETYCEILNRMDFTKEEAEKIAYGNISRILEKV